MTRVARLLAPIERLILGSLRVRFLRAADAIDLENPGPHMPGSYGAEWARLAMALRDVIPVPRSPS